MAHYVIITPANNEETFIEKTILSMVNQTVLPLKWVVVNDGSTDHTAQIVQSYAARHSFIELINLERQEGRHFGKKVRAFNVGASGVTGFNYEFIGNLDADISFDQHYFEQILCEFDGDPCLGIAGGMVSSWIDDRFVSQEVAHDSVAGAVQLFRRSCFEKIGGYLALPNGGIDAAAEITARMQGWKVQTFPYLRVLEHRRTGTATARPLASRLREGRRLYSLGYGFLFYCLRCVWRSREPPRLVGSAAALLGYLTSLFRRDPIVLSPEVVRYLRAEQRRKLLRALRLSTWRDSRG